MGKRELVTLDKISQTLQSQVDEIQNAIKAFNIKVVDTNRELGMILQRGVELDAREIAIVKAEEDIDKRTKRLTVAEKRLQTKRT